MVDLVLRGLWQKGDRHGCSLLLRIGNDRARQVAAFQRGQPTGNSPAYAINAYARSICSRVAAYFNRQQDVMDAAAQAMRWRALGT
jgi:hypothetical protein